MARVAENGPVAEPRAKYLPRRPALRFRTPRRYWGAIRGAEILDARMRARGISNIELGEVMGADEKLVRALRIAEESMTVGDLYAMDARLAKEIIERVLVDLIHGLDPSAVHR